MNDTAVRATDDWFQRQGFPTFIETDRPDFAPLRPALTVLVIINAAMLGLVSLTSLSSTVVLADADSPFSVLFPFAILVDLATVVVAAAGLAAPTHAFLSRHVQFGRLRTWRAALWIIGCLLAPAVALAVLSDSVGVEGLGSLAMPYDELEREYGWPYCIGGQPLSYCDEYGYSYLYSYDPGYLPEFIALATVRIAKWFLVILAVSWLTAKFGVLRLIWHSLKATFDHRRALTTVQAQVIPVAFIAVLFIFFSAETWQMTNQLTWTRVFIALVIIWFVALLPTAVVLRRQSSQLRGRRIDAGRLCGTPAEDFIDDEGVGAPDHTRTPIQKWNLWLAAGLRQSGLTIAVGLAVFTCLEVLGIVLVDRATAQQWIGPDVVVQQLASSELPFLPDDDIRSGVGGRIHDLWGLIAQSPAAMTRTAVLLGGFAAASVTVSLLSSAEHRDEYLGPTLANIDTLLTVRIFYCNRLLLHHRDLDTSEESG
ncbi:hypothetical protein Q0Z83_026840 [Actinoplanes sichuanensis]|uniref:Uncharacterized protein n=1 Tax=Actinoplanes sichuanensis TaxID=512349 RepID=A0ABW4ATW3_9ACTN|nr:hypothetical protein [Actinoplanes sichuanensis]BEL04493.1 hypothetical protein Q0Z83_026840 [Actinoplanes sichuanensis]